MTCTHCQAETADGMYLCDRCEGTLWDLLSEIPDTLEDAQDTVAMLERKGTPIASTGDGISNGINLDALNEVLALHDLLASWARMLLEETQEGAGESPIHYLRARLRKIVQHDWAGDMLEELSTARRKVEALVDTRRETIILRKCGTLLEDGTHCEAALKIRSKDQEWVECQQCGSWFSVEAVRREQKKKARGEPMRAADVRRYLSSAAGVQVSKKDMENWIQLGRLGYVLERVEVTKRPRRAYFPGDVLHLHMKMLHRRQSA